MSRIRKRSIAAVVAVMAAAIVTAAWSGLIRLPGQSVESITLGEGAQPVFALIYVAETKGYFEDEGLDVIYQTFATGRDALASVIRGETDVATVFETPVVLRVSEGAELGVVTSLHASTRNTALIARRDRGIERPEDLRGKRIAVTKNTNGEFFLFLYLTSQGIELSDVTIVDTPPYEIVDALSAGKVDAAATWNTHLYDARQAFAPDEAVVFVSDVYTGISMLAAKREFIDARRPALRKMLRALVRAERFLRQNEDEAVDIVIRRFPERSAETIRGVWDDFEPQLRLDNVLLSVLEREAEWFISGGKLQPPVADFRSVIVTDILGEVKPVAVTVR